jgi:hypothetical protein
MFLHFSTYMKVAGKVADSLERGASHGDFNLSPRHSAPEQPRPATPKDCPIALSLNVVLDT